MPVKLPKGIRLNNPGNVEHGQPWQGLDEFQTDERFCTFVGPEWGIRAIHKILQTYQTKYNLKTIDGMISKWAPADENDTDAYIKDVSSGVGVSRNTPVDLFDPTIAFMLVVQIIEHENANYHYDEETVWRGLKLAGVKTDSLNG